MKSLIVFFFFVSSLFSSEINIAVKQMKAELNPQQFKKESILLSMYQARLDNAEKLKKDIYDKKKSKRFEYLDELAAIQKSSQSAIISQYMLNQAAKYTPIKNVSYFKKYYSPSSNFLMSKGVCDGYLFSGIEADQIEGDFKKAYKIFKDGEKNCNVKWKKMELIGKYRVLKYKHGIK